MPSTQRKQVKNLTCLRCALGIGNRVLSKTALGVDTLLAGFGLHDDALHSPNEKFDLHCFELGCRTHALLMEELGELRK